MVVCNDCRYCCVDPNADKHLQKIGRDYFCEKHCSYVYKDQVTCNKFEQRPQICYVIDKVIEDYFNESEHRFEEDMKKLYEEHTKNGNDSVWLW